MSAGGPTRKPRTDIYTLMLLLSLLAIIIGTVFLYLETKEYGSPPYGGGPQISVRWQGGGQVAMSEPGCGSRWFPASNDAGT